MIYMFFDKKTGSGAIVSVIRQLAEQLHKPVVKKFMRDFKTIFGQQIQLKQNHCLQRMKILSFHCAIDFFIKYAWIKQFKDKKHKTIPNAFMKIVNESNRKRNKIWLDQGRKF